MSSCNRKNQLPTKHTLTKEISAVKFRKLLQNKEDALKITDFNPCTFVAYSEKHLFGWKTSD